MNSQRRAFLKRAALVPAGAGLAWTFASGDEASAPPPIQKPGSPKWKRSLNAYSFNKSLNAKIKGRGPGLSLFDVLDFCAELNFDAIDPTGYYFPGYPKVPTDKYLNDFKRQAFVRGLDISCTGIRNDF